MRAADLAARSAAPVLSAARPAQTVASLDLLRLMAALLVVLFHFGYYAALDRDPAGLFGILGQNLRFEALMPYAEAGWVGVYVFFVISGFVIAMSAQGKSPAQFAIGRVTRIWPALVVFATLALIAVLIRTPLPSGESLARWVRALLLSPQGPWIDGAIWTLTVEAVFYGLICLLIATLGVGRLPQVARMVALASALFWLVVMGGAATGIAAAYWAKVTLLTTGAFFALGILFYDGHRAGWTAARVMWCGVAMAASAAALAQFAQDNGLNADGQAVLLWAGLIVLGIVMTGAERRWRPGAGMRMLARRLGLMTYPLYLVHQISGGFVVWLLLQAGLGAGAAVSVMVGVILLVSYGFTLWIEPPLRRGLQVGLQRWA